MPTTEVNSLTRPGRRIMRRKEVAAELQICRTTLWRWIKEGKFPQPRAYGPNTMGWPEAVVDEWFEKAPPGVGREPTNARANTPAAAAEPDAAA